MFTTVRRSAIRAIGSVGGSKIGGDCLAPSQPESAASCHQRKLNEHTHIYRRLRS